MNAKQYAVAAAVGLAALGAVIFVRSKQTSDSGERIDAATIANLKTFGESLAAARASTIAAFTAADGAEHETLDARAAEAIEGLGAMLAEIRSGLPPGVVDLASAIVERYDDAHVQLMSFAINRKNREPGSVRASVEVDDRRAFERESAELGDRLQSAVTKRRI